MAIASQRITAEEPYLAGFVGDAPHVWGMLAGEIWRRARTAMRSGPLARWRFTGLTPDRILIAPPDLRIADQQIANEFYAGRFPLGNTVIETKSGSPFQIVTDNSSWLHALHNFRWLRHSRAAGTDLASANARALVADWLAIHGRKIQQPAWSPAVTAERVIAWLQHSPVVLQGADFSFYRNFVKSLAVQVRYLRAVANDVVVSESRLRVRIALAFAALSLPNSPGAIRAASRNLERELKNQILTDGGHVSRNPEALLELMSDLLPLRQTYANQSADVPPGLVSAIDRIFPALRGFRHEDGNLALFNGIGRTRSDRLAAVLRHDESASMPLLHGPYSGYQRLSMGYTTVIADTGKPPRGPDSGAAHAGCLSFELSSGRHRYIVNAGTDAHATEEVRMMARATAAHSTAALNDTSSCRFATRSWLRDMLGTPMVAGPRAVHVRRDDTKTARSFTARHDGYVPVFGLWHERSLTLSESGSQLDGIDRFFRAGEAAPKNNGQDRVTVRFHLHPSVNPVRNGDGHLMLMADNDDSWVFVCDEVQPSLEESIFFAGVSGPQQTLQIALNYKASEFPDIHWRFVRTGLGRWSQGR